MKKKQSLYTFVLITAQPKKEKKKILKKTDPKLKGTNVYEKRVED